MSLDSTFHEGELPGHAPGLSESFPDWPTTDDTEAVPEASPTVSESSVVEDAAAVTAVSKVESNGEIQLQQQETEPGAAPAWQYPPPPPPPADYNYPPPAVKKEKQPGRLVQPLPLRIFIAIIVLLIALLIVLHLTGSDWAEGALHASYAALIVAIGLLIALFIRSWDGMASSLNPTRLRQYMTAIICILVLFAYSGIFQILQPDLHKAQAASLESQQQWAASIHEYRLGGENSPDGKDLARVYASWGLALNKDRHYSEAMSKFDVVIKQFSHVGDQLKRAQDGDINARLGQGKQNLQDKSYNDATGHFDDLLNLSYCDATCQQQATALDATAYYNVGEQHLQAQDNDGAITAFDTVLSRFMQAPEAKQLHGDMAKALLGKGRTTRATTCSDAVPIYDRLSKEYADTPEGKTAQSDLNAPQDVNGHFTNADSTVTYTQIGLTHGLKGRSPAGDLFNKWDNATQTTNIQRNGTFAFHGVKQGDYDLIWYTETDTYRYAEFEYDVVTLASKYVAHVGPLCALDLGEVSNQGVKGA